MDWIYLAQIRDHWQVLVNPVRNLQLLYNVRPWLVMQMLVSQQELCLQHEFVAETSLFTAAVRAAINQSIWMFNICAPDIAWYYNSFPTIQIPEWTKYILLTNDGSENNRYLIYCTAAFHRAFSSHNFFSVLRRHTGLNERHISAWFIPAIFRSSWQQYGRNLFYSNQSQLYKYKHRWCRRTTSFYILAW